MNTPRAAVTLDATSPEPMGLATGGNATKSGGGWAGTVHGLSEAEKAKNFRKSLDRERAAANPSTAAAKSITDATMAGAQQATEPYKIQAFEPIKKHDRQGEWEDRITAMEAKLAAMSHFAREAQSPFKFVFLAEETGGTQWKEKTVNGSDIVEFEDGRKCASDDGSGQLIPLGANAALLEIPTGSTRAYVKLSGDGVYLVQPLDRGGMGKGFYHCGGVRENDIDKDPTADLQDVFNSYFTFEAGTDQKILVNLMEYFGDNAPELIIGAVYIAKRGRTNSDGREVYYTWGHTWLEDTLLVCGGVGSNGTSLRFSTRTITSMRSVTGDECVIEGGECPPPE